MGAFKEMMIECEQLQSAVEEIFSHANPYDETMIKEIAEENGLDAKKTLSHIYYMIGAEIGEPYFSPEYLPESLQCPNGPIKQAQ